MKYGEKCARRPYYWKLCLASKEILCGVKLYTSDKNALRFMIPFVASNYAIYHGDYIVERFRIEDVDGHALFDCFGDCFPDYERRHGIAK